MIDDILDLIIDVALVVGVTGFLAASIITAVNSLL